MVSRTFARMRSTALASAASAISILAAAPAAVGQTPAPSIQMLNIPAGPLGDSLLAINQAFGVSVLALEEAVAGKTAPQVSGAMTAEDALRRVLAGSGLTARTASDGSFVISEIKLPSVSAMPGADAVDAEMIIVTGTKANFGLQDTVESVAVITPDDIREQALNTITDILLRTANVSANGLGLGDLSIRGVALGGVGGTGQGSTSQIYVDGAPTTLDSSIGAFNLWDLGQVEILRGPQSTTQGRNALSGALIIRSADPDYDFGANARVLYGNENQLQTSAAITGPLIDEQIAFRLSADYRELDFEVINQDTGNNTRFSEALMLRGKVLFEPAAIPRLRAMFTASYMSNNFGESGAVSAPDMADPAFADFDPFGNETFGFGTRFEDTEIQRYIAEVSYDVSETWNLFALATFEDSTRQTDFGPGSENNADTQTYTAELRANFEYDRFSGWFGGYYFNSERTSSIVFSDSISGLGLPAIPADSIITAVSNTNPKTENYAFFGDVTFQVTDQVRLNLGARYDREQLRLNSSGSIESDPPSCIIAPFIPGFGGQLCTSLFPLEDEPPQSADFNAFLPRASVFYDVTQDISVGILYARGYRAGGSYIFSTPSNPGVVEVLQFDPEFLDNYELALRSTWPQYNLTVNANVFYSDWSDQQVSIPGPSRTLFDVTIANAGSSKIYGLEVEARADVTEVLSIFASLGITESEFTDFRFAETGQFANLAGNEFNAAPNLTASTGFAYNQEEGLFFSGNVSYTGAQFSDVENLEGDRTEAYVLVNGRIGYRTSFGEVSLFANNLLNDRFFLNRFTQAIDTETSDVIPTVPASFTVNDPRLWGVEARFAF